MASKDTLHHLVDVLPEAEIPAAERLLGELLNADPLSRALRAAPEDDEPTDPEEDAGAEEAWQQYLDGEALTADEAKRRLLR